MPSLPPPQADGSVRIGISGWTYTPWRGVFYPKDLPASRHLEFASRAFDSIELNGSFYSLQRPESYRRWRDVTPEGFVFSIKGSRYVTHMKRLRDVEEALANFFASGLLELGDKLGPILWQLPPSHTFDRQRLQSFFESLPRTHADARRLAALHSPWMKERASLGPRSSAAIRHTLEFRHPSFVSREAIDLFRAYRIAPCVADSAGQYPWVEDLCADFVYVRLHGSERLYTSGYGTAELREWAKRIRAWRVGRNAPKARLADPTSKGDGADRDVYVYFDNDVKVHAPFDAMNLTRLLSIRTETGTRRCPGAGGYSGGVRVGSLR